MSNCAASAQSAVPLAFKPKEHFEIGEALGLMDFEAASQHVRRALRRAQGQTGAAGARARRSSCSICTPTSTAIRKSRRRCWCAIDAMFGTAQLPKFKDDQFAALGSSASKA